MSFKLFFCLLQLYLGGCHFCGIQFFYAGNDCTGNLLFNNHILTSIYSDFILCAKVHDYFLKTCVWVFRISSLSVLYSILQKRGKRVYIFVDNIYKSYGMSAFVFHFLQIRMNYSIVVAKSVKILSLHLGIGGGGER